MDVLQTPLCIIGDVHSNHIYHHLVPCFGNFAHFQRPLDYLSFQAIAKNHMQRVAKFIGFDADKARHDAVDGSINLFRRVIKVIAECLLQQGGGPFPERETKSNMSLPK